jgi:hypothetical protein
MFCNRNVIQNMLVVVFWVMTLCSPVGGYQSLQETYGLHLQHSTSQEVQKVVTISIKFTFFDCLYAQ